MTSEATRDDDIAWTHRGADWESTRTVPILRAMGSGSGLGLRQGLEAIRGQPGVAGGLSRQLKALAVREVLATIAGKRANVLEIPGMKNWYVPVMLIAQDHEEVAAQSVKGFLECLRRGLEAL